MAIRFLECPRRTKLYLLMLFISLAEVSCQQIVTNLTADNSTSTVTWEQGHVDSSVLQVFLQPGFFNLSGIISVDASQCYPERLSRNVSQISLISSSLTATAPLQPTSVPGAPPQQISVQFPPRMDLVATVLERPRYVISNLTFLSPSFSLTSTVKKAPVDQFRGNFSTVLARSFVTWALVNGSYQPLKRPTAGLFEQNVPAEFGNFAQVSGILRLQNAGATLGLFMNNTFRIPLRTALFSLNLTGTGLARLTSMSYISVRLVINATGPNPCNIQI